MSSIFDHGYALVIGVDQNRVERLALPAVAKDVQAIYEVLIHPQRCAYNPDSVKLIRGNEATRANILETLSWLQEQVEADTEATAVVYYSGHGMFDRNADNYYLIPYDIRGLNKIRTDAIAAQDFTEEVAAIRPKRMLILLDCCHAAGLDAKGVELAAEAPHLNSASFPLEVPETETIPTYEAGSKGVHDLATGEGRAVLNSSTGAEFSYVRRDGRMSLFTYHLIEALTGHAPHNPEDATVLVTDVMSYVTREVAKTTAAEGRQQTPMMRTSGVFPVALVLGGEGAKGVESPPDPLQPLPQVPGMSITFNQEGQRVDTQVNIRNMDGYIEQIGKRIEGNQVNVDGVRNSAVAIGSGAEATHHKGDTFSGDFRGANVNIRSTLRNVTSSIGAMPDVDEEAKAELEQLIGQLEKTLQAAIEVAPAKADNAEAVSALTEDLIGAASDEKPNKTRIQIAGDGLKQASGSFIDVMPTVLEIATRIVTVVAAARA